MAIPVICEVSDKYLWTLDPFAHLFNTYWSSLQPVIVYGFTRPRGVLPQNFRFHQVSRESYPANKWSNALIEFLDTNDSELFVFLLCDYWLTRTVDHRGVEACAAYMRDHPDVLRMDLTTDRLYAGGMKDVESWGCYDIIETPAGTPYQMSLQAGIWRKSLMLKLLHLGMTAWEVETQIAPPAEFRVLGTRQWPVRYANAVLKGKIDNKQIASIPSEHLAYISNMIPKEWKG